MKINELEKVWEGKRDVRQEVESRWYTRKGELEDEVRAKLDAEFGVELAAAKAAEKEAEDNYDEENIRLREKESVKRLPYPLGTILVEWAYPRFRHDELEKTSNRAVLQIFKEGDIISSTVKWSRPDFGSLVLRCIKKDGTTGVSVEQWRNGYERRWLPEGGKPKN